MTQKEKILKLFEGGGWVKVQEMNVVAFRYGAIIFNLKKEGYNFIKRKQSFSNLEEWKMVERLRPATLAEEVSLVMPNPKNALKDAVNEVLPLTIEQQKALRQRLSAIKEHHGQKNI